MIQFSQRNPLFTNEKNVDVPVKAKQEWLFCLLVFTKMEIKCCKTEQFSRDYLYKIGPNVFTFSNC